MRVLVGPRTDLLGDTAEVEVARSLAGPDEGIVSLRELGVGNLARPLTQAEVALLREALSSAEGTTLVGYVCKGVGLGDARAMEAEDAERTQAQVVAVTDHANLTWRSPLAGPNDERVGPRFPSMDGVYEPGVVTERAAAVGGIILRPGVVAGVGDDRHLNAYEAGTVGTLGHAAASSELVPVVIVAAHMGLRVAAAVVAKGGSQEEETDRGRS
jgi:hypothetical protein